MFWQTCDGQTMRRAHGGNVPPESIEVANTAACFVPHFETHIFVWIQRYIVIRTFFFCSSYLFFWTILDLLCKTSWVVVVKIVVARYHLLQRHAAFVCKLHLYNTCLEYSVLGFIIRTNNGTLSVSLTCISSPSFVTTTTNKKKTIQWSICHNESNCINHSILW